MPLLRLDGMNGARDIDGVPEVTILSMVTDGKIDDDMAVEQDNDRHPLSGTQSCW